MSCCFIQWQCCLHRTIVGFIVTKGCCTMLPTCYAISPSSYSLLQMHRYYCHSSLYPCIHVPCIRDILIQSAPHTMFRRTGRHSQNFGWDNIWSRHVTDVHVVQYLHKDAGAFLHFPCRKHLLALSHFKNVWKPHQVGSGWNRYAYPQRPSVTGNLLNKDS